MIRWLWSMKRVGVTYSVLFLVVALHLELTSYVFKSYSWTRLSPIPPLDPKNPFHKQADEPYRILLVADPQLLGENDEVPLLGIFSRWDSDRYLSRTYRLARYHVQPDIVIFLGDLFDEARVATEAQLQRYYKRFRSVFLLRKKKSLIHYIYLPGDNDVGGENEPVFLDKVKWFNETMGEIGQSVVAVLEGNVNIRFMMMHLFLPDSFENPVLDFDYNTSTPELRVALTHISCLKIFTQICAKRLEHTSPVLILSADSHRSTYYQLKRSRKKMRRNRESSISVYKDFLVPELRNSSYETEMFDRTVEFGDQSLKLHLSLTNGTRSRLTHEITVPTCSYRMGVPNMGYGSLQIYKNGTVEYQVLWLPSRFHQLYVYVGFYIVSKFLFTPWIFWRVSGFLWRKYLALRSRFRTTYYKHQV